jgi:PAS domain S-box-containing protein
MKDGIERDEGSSKEPQSARTPTDHSSSNDHEKTGESLRDQLDFEQILSELSAAFVNLPGDRLDSEIQVWLERIGRQLDLDLCTVWQVAGDGENFNVTHVCSTAGSAVFPPKLPYTAFPYTTARMFNGEILVFSSVDDLPAEADSEKQVIRAIGLKSTAAFPLAVGGSYIGAVTFGTLSHERTWPESLLRRLRMVGEIFANALALRQSQEAIRRERDSAQRYLNIAGTILVALDTEQRVTMINQKGCQLLGCPEDEIIGRKWFDTFLPAPIRETVKNTFVPLMIGEKEPAAYYENAILTKTGDERLIAWNNTLLRDERGGIIGTLSSGEDITERKWAEQKLRESEEKYRSLVDTAVIGITMISPQMEVLSVNNRFKQWIPHVDVSMRPTCYKVFNDPPRDDICSYCPVVKTFGDGEVHEAVTETPTGRGIRNYHVVSSPVFDAEGKVVAVIETVEDITERKRAAEALRYSEEKLTKVFQSSPALISISSLNENKFTEVNETFLSTLGFERDEVIGRSVAEINIFIDPGTRDEIVRRVREQGFIRHMHVRARTRSGEILDGLLSAESIEVRGHRYLLSVTTDITEQRRMERALRKSKERFERVTQESREMVWEVDTNGLFTYVNAACVQILGYRPDEMIGKMHFYELHPKEGREEFRRQSLKQISDRSTFHNSVNRVITRDGREVWFLTSGAPLFDESGNLEGYTGADLDITERKIMEETLAAERRLFIGGPTVVFKWRAEKGRSVEYVSPNVVNQFGYNQEEFTSGRLAYAQIVHPDDVQRIADELEASGSAGDNYLEQEYRISRPDGECLWVRDFTVLVRDSSNAVTHYHGYVLDITRRKRAEEALRESEERFLKAFHSSPAMMVMSTIDEGRLIEVNNVFLTTLGFKRDEVIGRTTLELNVFADPQHRDTIIRTVREKGSMRNVDGTLRLRNGEIRQCLFSGEIIELSGEKYLLSVVSDITERKRFATMLKYAVEGTSAATGRNFFRSMVNYLATALDMRYALIGEIDEADHNSLMTLAVWAGGKIGKNFRHTLANGPCADIFERAICLHPANVRELFPRADLVAELGVESVLGMPLSDSSGEPLGILAVMDDKPFSEDMIPHAKSLVSIFAARASAELERLRVEEELRQTTERLEVEREELAEKNVALKQILGHLEREKIDYKHEISASVENLMMPYIRKLRAGAGQLKPRELDALQNAVESIIGKDIDQFLNNFAKLTPRERDICEQIKNGLTSKGIADVLNIDVLTVHKHRDAIRRKLQLKHKDLNLTSYLRSR